MENSSAPGNNTSSSSSSSTAGSSNNESATNASKTTTTTSETKSAVAGSSRENDANAVPSPLAADVQQLSQQQQQSRHPDRKSVDGGAAAAGLENGVGKSYYHHRAPASSSSTSTSSLGQSGSVPTSATEANQITVNISTTTGGSFSVTVDTSQTVDQLKKSVAKKLRVSKDRICLLHRERELQEGTLRDNGLCDGSKIILIPNVETGLLAQRPESTVMQALESLNDSQVNDFLSGKSPLNLNMRLGDHMMIIQLQLSTVNPPSLAAPSPSSASGLASCHSQHHPPGSSSLAGAAAGASESGGTTGKKRPASTNACGGARHSVTSSKSSRHHHSHYHCQGGGAAAAATSHRLGNDEHHHHSQTEVPSASLVSEDSMGMSSTGSSRTGLAVNHLPEKSTTAQHHHHHQNETCPGNVIVGDAATAIRDDTRISTGERADAEDMTADSVLNIEANTNQNDEVLDEIMKFHDEGQDGVGENNNEDASQRGVVEDIIEMVTEGEEEQEEEHEQEDDHATERAFATAAEGIEDQSPIRSLSNLVSGPIINVPETATPAQFSDPIAAKLTSCLCKRFDAGTSPATSSSMLHCDPSSCPSKPVTCEHGEEYERAKPRSLSASRSAMDLTTNGGSSSYTSSTSSPLATRGLQNRHQWLHRTANNPILKSKPTVVAGPKSSLTATATTATTPASTTASASSTPPASNHNQLRRTMSNPLDGAPTVSALESPTPVAGTSSAAPGQVAGESAGNAASTASAAAPTVIDTRALAEASRNLTQTLKKLSKEVFTNKVDISENNSKRIGTGAVIESMKHHGKGIYSGTFSGTLNPALQDRYGRPKRDISTIIHILNDLLSATPQYRRGASISFDTGPGTGTSSTATTTATTSGGSSSFVAGSSTSHTSHGHHSHSHHHHHGKGTSSSSSSSLLGSSRGQIPSSSSRASRSHHHHHHHHHSHHHQHSSHHHHHQQYPSQSSAIHQKGSNASDAEMRPCVCNGPPAVQQSANEAIVMIPSTDAMMMEEGMDVAGMGLGNGISSNGDGSSISMRETASSTGLLGDDVLPMVGGGGANAAADTGLVVSNLPTCCSKCSSVAIENHKTKSKLDQLRLVMQQKKERREARKLKNAPYGMVNVVGAGGSGDVVPVAVTKNPHQSTNYKVAAAASETTPVVEAKAGDSQDLTVQLDESPSSADTSLVEDPSAVNADNVEGSSSSDEQQELNSAQRVATGAGGGDGGVEASEGNTSADNTSAGEEQQQQQQQNHLVEEVDTAA